MTEKINPIVSTRRGLPAIPGTVATKKYRWNSGWKFPHKQRYPNKFARKASRRVWKCGRFTGLTLLQSQNRGWKSIKEKPHVHRKLAKLVPQTVLETAD